MTQTELLIALAFTAALCVVIFVVAAIRIERLERQRQADDAERLLSRYGGE